MLPQLLAALAAATAVFSFQDPAIIESSGLVADADGLFVTVNDSGDSGRVFVVDDSGATVGTTTWSPAPVDVEALAPAGDGEVWVGDIGDNARSRETISVLRVPYGRGDRAVTPAAYELVYPDHAHDAETLLAAPDRLYVVTKDLFGGGLYAAPKRLSEQRPNRLRRVGPAPAVATDGSFFPDGRHYVIRGYGSATVYSYPDRVAVGSTALPAQEQGEGISVGADDELYLSSEGEHAEVLRVRLPADVRRAIAGPTPDASTPAGPVPDAAPSPDDDGPPWSWLLGGGVVAFVAGAGWLLLRRGQAA